MTRIGEQAGFTLVEILVSVAVFAIAIGAAIPNSLALLQQHQLRSSSKIVAFEITRARMQAVVQNCFVRVQVDDTGSKLCRQTAESQTGPWSPESCTEASSPVQLPRPTRASGTGPTFDGKGLATSSGEISIFNEIGQKGVQYNILGRVSVS